MDKQIEKLEEFAAETKDQLARLAARGEVIVSQMATKVGLAEVREQLSQQLTHVSARVDTVELQMATKRELADVSERLARLETRVDGISVQMATQMATKADLLALQVTMLKWFIGTAITMVGLTFAIARYIR